MGEVLKIFGVLIPCALFGKMGMLSAIAAFKFNFWKVMAVNIGGGVGGSVLFTYVSSSLLKWWDRMKAKYFKTHRHPRIFTRSNRLVVKAKRRFGLYGVAFLTPVLLSYPVGVFIAERLYKEKKKVILAMAVSVIFWSLTLYGIFYFLYSVGKSI